MVTLDGLGYTFNGLGEYFLVDSSVFTLQGRTSQLGNGEKATFFSTVVAKQTADSALSDSVEFKLNQAANGIGINR